MRQDMQPARGGERRAAAWGQAIARAGRRLAAAWACLLLALALAAAPARAQAPDFAQVFREHGVTMLVIEADSGRIVDANPAAARFYGYSEDTLRSMVIQQINIFTPEQVAAERKLAESEGRNYFIFRHRLASGEIRTVEVYSRPYLFDGRRLLLSLINDITPGRNQAADLWHYQKRLEEMVDAQVREIERGRQRQLWLMAGALLAQAVVIAWLVVNIQRRRRLQREREELLASLEGRNQELLRLGEVMAHHFQEPVRRLVSYAQRLQRHAGLAQNEDARQSLGYIDEQARRLSQLVNDAQRYLALDQVRLTAPGQATDTAAALQAAINASGLDPAQVQLAGPLPAVRLTERQLRQLFAILLENARRYCHPQRPLQVRVSARAGSGGLAEFRVADNGSGIAPEYREQVFGLFTRLVPADVPGTGMGLALVAKLVSLVGGRARIEDGIDGGACVVFELPMEGDTRQ